MMYEDIVNKMLGEEYDTDEDILIELWKQMHIAYLREKDDNKEKLKTMKWMHDKVNMYFSYSERRNKRERILEFFNDGNDVEEFVNLFTLEEFRCIGI